MMHQPVEDGVSEGGIADHLVPVLDRQLTRHERGTPSGPILDKLEEIAPFPVAKWGKPPVVKNQEVGLGERLHELSVRAVGTRVHEFLTQEAGQSHVAHGMTLAARALAERTR